MSIFAAYVLLVVGLELGFPRDETCLYSLVLESCVDADVFTMSDGLTDTEQLLRLRVVVK